MNITILGAGAWGTALGIHFAKHNHQIAMWTHNAEHAQTTKHHRTRGQDFFHRTFTPNCLQRAAS